MTQPTENVMNLPGMTALMAATLGSPVAAKALLQLIALVPSDAFGSGGASAVPAQKDERIGQPVIVRANKAGAYVGILAGYADNNPDCPILAPGSRQIHYWARGGSVSSLAVVGMVGDGHRLTPAAKTHAHFSLGAEVVQIVQIKDHAIYETFLKVPDWTGQ